MKTKATRFLSLLLALLMVCMGALTACTTEPEEKDPVQSDDTTPEGTTPDDEPSAFDPIVGEDYALSDEELYDKIHEYTFSHFSDKEFGEWYGYLHRDGTVSHTQKGSLWKGPYHLLRCLILCEQILSAVEEERAMPDLL